MVENGNFVVNGKGKNLSIYFFSIFFKDEFFLRGILIKKVLGFVVFKK